MGKSSKDKRDAYYRLAKEQGWRARSAFKLIQLDETFELFKDVTRVVDLCAAPGSWSQVLSRVLIEGQRIGRAAWEDQRYRAILKLQDDIEPPPPSKPREDVKIVAIDLQPMSPLPGITCLKADITHPSTIPLLLKALDPDYDASTSEASHPVDLVLSDGAPDVTGLHDLDIYIQSQLLWAALNLALCVLKPGGTFVAKIFRGKDVDLLYAQMKTLFETVTVAKPRSSRASSVEAFIVCQNFRPPKGFKASLENPLGIGKIESGLRDMDLDDENRWIAPFLACGDLSAFDADASHKLPEGHVSLDPIQPPTAPPYKRALEERKKMGGAYGKVTLARKSNYTGTLASLQINLQNQTTSNRVYAYITGIALDNNGALFLLQSDARTPYYPSSPSSTGTKLAQNVSIALGAPGTTVTATIPHLAGGRIWFSQDAELQFFLNPGPGLVEPSVFNQSDPNINTNFAFCEFTFNTYEVFVNISYVDFVSALPVALTLTDTSGGTQHVSGLPSNGLDTICNGLTAQTNKDNRRWSSLIVQYNGKNLRALSPNSGVLLHPTWFQTYWSDYIDKVWSTYTSKTLTINTQASFGNVTGQVNSSGNLCFNNAQFSKPTGKDIFSCSTGPFQTGSDNLTNVIIPRLSAAINRSTLLISSNTPNSTGPNQYYQDDVTNHYSRIVHAANLDAKGYSFPYDDVTPDGGIPIEGALNSSKPASLTVTVGGTKAYC